jgi:hypothetical protein
LVEGLKAQLELALQAARRAEATANALRETVAEVENQRDAERRKRQAAEGLVLQVEEEAAAERQDQDERHAAELAEMRADYEQMRAERDEAISLMNAQEGEITRLKDEVQISKEWARSIQERAVCPQCRGEWLKCLCCKNEFRT